jgi:hypothetical protein
MLDAVSDLVRPPDGGGGGSDLGAIAGSVQLEWLSDLGAIGGGSKHVETARPSEGSGGPRLFHISEFIDNIRPRRGGSGGGVLSQYSGDCIQSVLFSVGSGGGSGYVASAVSGTQQKVLFEQFPLLLIPVYAWKKTGWWWIRFLFFLIEFQFGPHLILKPLKTVVEPLIAALEYEDLCVRLVEPRRPRRVPHDWRGFPQYSQRLVRIHHLLVVCIHRPLSCHRHRST